MCLYSEFAPNFESLRVLTVFIWRHNNTAQKFTLDIFLKYVVKSLGKSRSNNLFSDNSNKIFSHTHIHTLIYKWLNEWEKQNEQLHLKLHTRSTKSKIIVIFIAFAKVMVLSVIFTLLFIFHYNSTASFDCVFVELSIIADAFGHHS